MKRCFAIVFMMIILSIIGTSAETNIEDFGIWQMKYYVDEFNDRTDEWYITTEVQGTFSNSATTNSDLRAILLVNSTDNIINRIDDYYNRLDGISIMLYEYNEHKVTNSYSEKRHYTINIKDSNGEKHSLEGIIYSGSDRIELDLDNSDQLFSILSMGGKTSFSIIDDALPTTHYVFSVYDTKDGIENALYYAAPYQRAVLYNREGNYTKARSELTWILVHDKNFHSPQFDSLRALIQSRAYDGYSPFYDGRANVYRDEKYGYIDVEGTLVVPCDYDSAADFSEGLACVSKEINGQKQYGYIDVDGNIVMPFGTYDYASSFYCGLAVVKQGDKYGFIDHSGQMAIAAEWDGAGKFLNGYACVVKDGKYGCIDTSGNIVIEPQYDGAFAFQDSLAAVPIQGGEQDENNRYYYINVYGEQAFDGRYKTAGMFSDGLAFVIRHDDKTESNHYEFIDKTGKTVFSIQPNEINNVGAFKEGLVFAKNAADEKIGFLNKKGELVIPYQYTSVALFDNGFNEGFIGVSIDEKWGIIDREGNIVIPIQYDDLVSFNEGYCIVRDDKYISIFDTDGNKVY